MKKAAVLFFAGLSAMMALGQDKVINDPHAATRAVPAFHAIQVSQGIELIIKQGNREAVAVSAATTEYRDNIKTLVENGVLKIYYDTKWYRSWDNRNKKLKAYVSFKEIDLLHGSSGSVTTVDGNMHVANIRVELFSGAGFSGAVEAGHLDVQGGSGATAHISGRARSAGMKVSSGAGIYGYDLVTDTCHAEAGSGGMIQVSVNRELSARASSGGDIQYKGNGAATAISTGSGGKIKKYS